MRPGSHCGASWPHTTIACVRVSSHGQRARLERQKQVLELYCASKGWRVVPIVALGSARE